MIQYLILAMLLMSGQSESNQVPDALARALSRRMSFKTALFCYESKKRAPITGDLYGSRFEVRMTENDIYWHDLGDSEGIVMRDPQTGRAILGVKSACSSDHTIRHQKTGEEWFKRDGDPRLFINYTENAPNKWRLTDPRSFGLSPDDLGDQTPAQWLETLQRRGARWTQRSNKGLIEVTMISEPQFDHARSHGETIWLMDPAKDDAIVEVRGIWVEADGSRTPLAAVKNEYVEVDQRWCLTRSECTEPKTGTQSLHVIHRAEFDRRDHPQILDVETLALPAGIEAADFRLRRDGKKGRELAARHLGGGLVVSEEEWRTSFREQFDQDFLREYAKSERREYGNGQYPRWWSADEKTLGLEFVAHTPDLWEAYVRRWILRHSHDIVVDSKQARSGLSLSEAQVESAWGILKDCRKRAKPILRKREEARTTNARNTKPGGDVVQVEATKSEDVLSNPEELDRFERELSSIFDLLRTRLDGLLRSKQVVKHDVQKPQTHSQGSRPSP